MNIIHRVISAAVVVTAVTFQLSSARGEAETAFLEVTHMSVPEGGGEEYLAMERVWSKFHRARRDAGLIKGWGVFKVKRTHGPKSDYNYGVVTVYESWDHLNKGGGYIDGDKISDSLSDKEKALMARTGKIRKMQRVQLWGLEASALPWKWGRERKNVSDTILFGFMKSKNFQHLNLEKNIYQKIWAKAVDEGYQVDWHLWRQRYPFGEKIPYDLIAAHFVPDSKNRKSMPDNWFQKTAKELFPDQADSLGEKTNAARDIPIVEEWTRVGSLD